MSGLHGTVNITVNDEPLVYVRNFKYLGTKICDNAPSNVENVLQLGMATSKMSQPEILWEKKSCHITVGKGSSILLFLSGLSLHVDANFVLLHNPLRRVYKHLLSDVFEKYFR